MQLTLNIQIHVEELYRLKKGGGGTQWSGVPP